MPYFEIRNFVLVQSLGYYVVTHMFSCRGRRTKLWLLNHRCVPPGQDACQLTRTGDDGLQQRRIVTASYDTALEPLERYVHRVRSGIVGLRCTDARDTQACPHTSCKADHSCHISPPYRKGHVYSSGARHRISTSCHKNLFFTCSSHCTGCPSRGDTGCWNKQRQQTPTRLTLKSSLLPYADRYQVSEMWYSS